MKKGLKKKKWLFVSLMLCMALGVSVFAVRKTNSNANVALEVSEVIIENTTEVDANEESTDETLIENTGEIIGEPLVQNVVKENVKRCSDNPFQSPYQPIDVSKCDVRVGNENFRGKNEYTAETFFYAKGKEIIPKVKVTYRGDELEEGKDYKATFGNNVEPCENKFVVTIYGKGRFCGEVNIYFSIKRRSIEGSNIKAYTKGPYVWNGKYHMIGSIRIVDTSGRGNLEPGVDYNVTIIADKSDAEKTQYTITGIGIYEGSQNFICYQ